MGITRPGPAAELLNAPLVDRSEDDLTGCLA